MDNSCCEWIRGRLPLYAGADDAPGVEGCGASVDLGEGDRRAIERHLARCPACRGRRADLIAAMGALAAVASTSPVDPASPSLWPALERRMSGRGAGSEIPASSASMPIWARLDDDRPMRAAWAHDTMREAAEALGWGDGPDRPRWRIPSGARRVAVASLAASILMLSVVLPVAWRWRAAAGARELAFAEPVPPLVGPPAPAPDRSVDDRLADLDAPAAVPDFDETGPDRDSDSDSDRGPEPRALDARQLAQADPIKAPAPSTPAAAPGASPTPGPSRFGYELELGTSTPPDGRDARPIY